MQQLSKRLMAVSNLVTPGDMVVDVGTDHAYVPIYLVQSGKIKKALAMDVGKGPLFRASEHIKTQHLEDVIHTRLSDGLCALKEGEGGTLIIAGMGGNLVIHILEGGAGVLPSFHELILQPQSEIGRVRAYLREHCFRIAQEDMVEEDGKFYPMMRVVPMENGKTKPKDAYIQQMEDEFGPLLLEKRHPVLLTFLQRQEKEYETIIGHLKAVTDEKNRESRQERMDAVIQKQKMVQKAIELYC